MIEVLDWFAVGNRFWGGLMFVIVVFWGLTGIVSEFKGSGE